MSKSVKEVALKATGCNGLAGSSPASPTIDINNKVRVYGPYTRKDKRQHVCILYPDGKRITLSYPRYLMEAFLGRKLAPEEHIDHINNDPTDNRIENLQILSQKENNRKFSILNPRKIYTFVCPCCKKETQKYLNYVLGNIKKGSSGPYCSRSCAGKASHQHCLTTQPKVVRHRQPRSVAS